MASPLDVTGAIVLQDQTTKVLAQVEKNTKKTADEMAKSGDKAGKSFVKWGSAVNALVGFLKKVGGESEKIRATQELFWDATGDIADTALEKFEAFFRSTGDKQNALADIFNMGIDAGRKNLAVEKITKEINALSVAQEKILASSRKNVLTGTSFFGISDEEKEVLLNGALSDAIAEVAKRIERLEYIRASLSEGITADEAGKLYDISVTKIRDRSKEITDDITKYNEEAAKRMGDLWEDMAKKQADAIKKEYESTFEYGYKKATEAFGNMAAIGEQTANLISDSFSTFFFDVFEQRTFRAADLLKSLLTGAAKIFFNQAGLGIASGLGSIFPGSNSSQSNAAIPVVGGGSSGALGGGQVFNVNINAVDSQSFAALAARNPQAIGGAVQMLLSSSPSFRQAVSAV